MAGAFQTTRDIFENPIWQNIVEFRLFFLIYGKAAFTDGVRTGDIVLKRGQWVRSIRNLQSDLEYLDNRAVKRYSTSTISRAIDKLKKQERIITFDTELGTLFEVVNYAKYQGFENYSNSNLEQQRNSDETATKQQRNNNKNTKNTKKSKKDIIYTPEFENFYEIYPNPFNKEQTFKNWNSLLKKDVTVEIIQKATMNYLQYIDDNQTDPKYYYRSTNFLGNHEEYKGYVDYKPRLKVVRGQASKPDVMDLFKEIYQEQKGVGL